MNDYADFSTAPDHLEWARTRALEYLDRGDPNGALGSFLSDLNKHSGTRGHVICRFPERVGEDSEGDFRAAFRKALEEARLAETESAP